RLARGGRLALRRTRGRRLRGASRAVGRLLGPALRRPPRPGRKRRGPVLGSLTPAAKDLGQSGPAARGLRTALNAAAWRPLPSATSRQGLNKSFEVVVRRPVADGDADEAAARDLADDDIAFEEPFDDGRRLAVRPERDQRPVLLGRDDLVSI